MSQEQAPYQVPPPYYQDDEITLKELILKLGEFGRELWHNKLLLLLIAAIGVGGFLAKNQLSETTYDARMSFLIEGNNLTQQTVQSPFGPIEIGGVENNKITELARSGRIIHQVLFQREVIDGEYDYIANHLIDLYNYHEGWNKEKSVEEYSHMNLADFYFTEDSILAFSPKEYRALSELQELVAGNKLVNEKGVMDMTYDTDTDIFRLDVKSINEAMSLTLMRAVYDELRAFYTEETVGRTRRGFEKVSSQTDSLYTLLLQKERAVASSDDRTRSVYSSLPTLNTTKLKREKEEIQSDYQSSLQTKRSLEVLLSQDTPEFQIIDQTFLPVENSPSTVKAIALGGFLGLFLGSLFVIGRKIIRDAMAG